MDLSFFDREPGEVDNDVTYITRIKGLTAKFPGYFAEVLMTNLALAMAAGEGMGRNELAVGLVVAAKNGLAEVRRRNYVPGVMRNDEMAASVGGSRRYRVY